MHLPDSIFEGANNILDVGGWFKPEPRATHVVDLMPWETRGAELSLAPLPGERFSKATWFQADFLKPGFRLPFDDKSFDLVTCGHTIEDLADPGTLLNEMQRVGKRGIIECPSRLKEQTKGVRDRQSSLPGHPHHHWIVESVDGCLLLYSKADSRLNSESRLLPLTRTEQATRAGQKEFVHHAWEGAIRHRFVTGRECEQRAEEFVAAMDISPYDRARDSVRRFGRRIRAKFRHVPTEDPSWWPKIVAVSLPYSSIELK